jgi:hypothetical protein
VLGSSSTFPQIDNSPDVITAIGVGPAQLYAGLYSGDVYVSASPYTIWTPIGGPDFPGSPTPSRVVTSIAVDPDDGTGYVTFSGFRGPHVFKTTPSGTWTTIDGVVPDVPCNAIAVERDSGGAKALWLATDIGIFRRPADLSADWTTSGGGGFGAGGLPNGPVYALSVDEAHNRIYAGTHGRGVWVLTKPFVSNLEGWVNGSIWDIPVYGSGFVQVPGQTCTMTIINADTSICGSDTVDVMGGTIGIDSGGALTTSQTSMYGGKQVVWACFNGHCLHNVDITTCNPSTIKVDCTGNVTGVGTIAGCTPLGDPPSVTLNLGDPTPNAPAAPSFSVVATIQDGMGVGMTRALCSASVSFQLTEDNDAVMARAAAALNASPQCVAQGVTADTESKSIQGPEDEIRLPQRLLLHAPSLSGTQLVPAIQTSPGSATGVCFQIDDFGVPATSALVLPRVRLIAGAGGAAGGGRIRLQEISAVGSCTVQVTTSPGETASAIAADLANQFLTQGIPGPADCPSRENPADVTQDGGSLIFISARQLVMCVDDANVGFAIAPEELKQLDTPPVVQCHDVTVPVDASCHACGSVASATFDGDGDALTCSASPACPFGLGTTPETVTCTDPGGLSTSCTANLIAVDTTRPTLTLTSTCVESDDEENGVFTLGKQIAFNVHDNCDPNPKVKIVNVTANRGTVRFDQTHFCARLGEGRVYTVTAQATDASGNASTANMTLKVADDDRHLKGCVKPTNAEHDQLCHRRDGDGGDEEDDGERHHGGGDRSSRHRR